jgi:serine/threonine protein kinase
MQTAPDVISSLRLENLDTLPVLARYELRREVGRGGMSVVYEAYDRHTEQTVALKVLNAPTGISPDQAELILSQFLCEARAVAGLSHPNVIAIYDTGEENGRHFLVMEFLEGETLRERLVRGPMTLDQAEPVLRQVAAALDAVHTRGILHGDIKPSNVLLSIDGTAKLLDFGIALHIDDCAQVIAGPLMGSPAYLSPEQIRGNRGSAASDIWALGTLLYEMLAGRPAFTGKSVSDVLHRVMHEETVPIPDLSPAIQRVLHRALDKNPLHRYPAAHALADAFRLALPAPEAVRSRQQRMRSWAFFLIPIVLGLALVLLSRSHPQGLSLGPVPNAHFIHPLPAIRPLQPIFHSRHEQIRHRHRRLRHSRSIQKFPVSITRYTPRATVAMRRPHRLSVRSVHPVHNITSMVVHTHFPPRKVVKRHRSIFRHSPQRVPIAFHLAPIRPYITPVSPKKHDSSDDDNLSNFIYSPESP